MKQLRALPTRKLRVLSTVLWFFAGWYVANFAVALFGANAMVGPIVGIAAAALIGADPFRVLWTSKDSSSPVAGSPLLASGSTTD
jgi:hypothetical protein